MRARRAAVALTFASVPVAVIGLAAAPASSHGTMQTPISRALTCYQENPESPRSAACKAAVAAGGPQAFYDWNGIRIGDAGGRHRQRIPDGRLCSAGNAAFKGLDLARADWPATRLTSGASYTFRFKATARHRGGFQLYITRNGYNPAKPLRWSDLERAPFLSKADPAVRNGAYTLPGRLPAGKTGRHLIYGIWQRSDSPEAFYSCSDVIFGKGGSSGGAVTTGAGTGAGTTPSKPPTPAPPGPSKPAAGSPPTTAASGHHHGAVDLRARPASGGTPAEGTATGTALIAGAAGLTLGGIGGLLLTGRRRRTGTDTGTDTGTGRHEA
ncbi:lytic polysaccharide monooxygenase [Spirillospora sp. NPDC047279]|uniref:lytic polysaccharide monooxygenase auxiliary activity family 9 protein n=1 Tax=Spirillospora sp. NPDC047279 TaxID=3155478 RepID=UPI0033CC6F64